MSGKNPVAFLRDLQEQLGGAIPVEAYIREALYHPELGYYSRHIRTVGRRGDFATTATLGEGLALALARWLTANRPAAPTPWHVIEVGAGTGQLAATILQFLGWWTRRALNYHIVESSPVLRAEQQTRLARRRVHWHDALPAALTAADGRALIFSNELIDAFPCRVFERRNAAWFEVALRLGDSRLEEILLARPVPPSTIFDQPFPDGQRVEVHVAAAEWLASWASDWTAGKLLTIDYGDTADRLLVRRPRGTLRAYFHHQRADGPEIFHRFGRQDITADVNFSDLESWGHHLGFTTERLTTQSEFLAEFGTKRRAQPAHDAALAEISGAGSAFKVLIQQKSHPTPTPPKSPASPLPSV